MKALIFLSVLFLASGAWGEQVIRLEGISIQGNSEEPNVMYIMPWRAPPGTGRLYQPINSYRQQWLEPTDRARFNRELRYAERYAPKERNQERLRQLMADETSRLAAPYNQ
ncbi:MAG: hypothetical protein CMI02_18620 [Oceanospirillaceae bacterium]|nr:hypothetical protein [Oceanospirillaceae bacterium]MBT14041.1 hypothetical protein [Oceanospirillaceae bacterium]|tara:strand:+ start:206503 stop:206835 length:333 start_codon:yes stop_codon:yes gene_type:complete